jgi:hypothetical protein
MMATRWPKHVVCCQKNTFDTKNHHLLCSRRNTHSPIAHCEQYTTGMSHLKIVGKYWRNLITLIPMAGENNTSTDEMNNKINMRDLEYRWWVYEYYRILHRDAAYSDRNVPVSKESFTSIFYAENRGKRFLRNWGKFILNNTTWQPYTK